eukprot:185521-Prymnesium_polylepis.1
MREKSWMDTSGGRWPSSSESAPGLRRSSSTSRLESSWYASRSSNWRAPQPTTAPRPREHVGGAEHDDDVGAVDAALKKGREINEIDRVEVDLGLQHPLQQIVQIARVRARLRLVVRQEACVVSRGGLVERPEPAHPILKPPGLPRAAAHHRAFGPARRGQQGRQRAAGRLLRHIAA